MGVIHFLNVNEGDCIWVKHLSGHNSIIDISNGQEVVHTYENASLSGNHNQKNYPVNPIEYLKDRNVSTIFRFILTHPDMDHMDGLKNNVARNIIKTGVLQLNNINFFETLDIALFFCQFFCIFYSYFLVLCDIIVSGGVSYG